VQRAIAAKYSESKVIEVDCGHEFLVEVPGETAARISEFAAALRTLGMAAEPRWRIEATSPADPETPEKYFPLAETERLLLGASHPY
jgi:hypothetical protein